MSYYVPVVSLVVTFILTKILLNSRAANKITDIPNERSLHIAPVPRIGGIALIIGVLSGWLMIFNSAPWWIVIPLFMIFLVSILDDIRGLSVRYRLFIHVGAAFLFVLGCGFFSQNWLAGILVILTVVWVINLYNFMDGSDGLAGGMALFGFAMYGIAATLRHDANIAILNFSVSAAALSFLYFNFNPAKIFMGDAGSTTLGFLAAAMGVWGWKINLWSVWFPLLVFSPFLMDSTVTLLKRAFRMEKIWQAHREHYYQRIVQLGLGHRNTALSEYFLMVCLGISALIALQYEELAYSIILIWSVVFSLIMLSVDYLWKMNKNA